MKVVVLGSGVIGVTTAYFLARDGHEVQVLERNDKAALETSYANAGLVAPGHAYAWASPKAPDILIKSLFKADQALKLKLRLSLRQWQWMWSFWMQCTEESARLNTLRKLRLCMYSVEQLQAVVADTSVSYDGLTKGNLYLYRSQANFDAGAARTQILQDHGLEMKVVDREELAALEPSLDPVKDKFAGGMYSPMDQSGDARMFTQGLAAHCASQLGVEFSYGCTINRLHVEGDSIRHVSTDNGDIQGDVYVLSLGCSSPFLSEPVGVKLPIYPVKGYSVTIRAGGGNQTPQMGGVDEQNLVAFCPMGERLRVTSTAEFAGYDRGHTPSDFRAMFNVARELFPNADYDQPEYWAGLRPMTPTTVPILGKARYRNLYLNTGHGHIGWTMSCGSAKLTADLIAEREGDIDTDGLLYGG